MRPQRDFFRPFSKLREDQGSITYIEKYKSKEAFDFHCNTSYIKGFFDEVVPPLMDGVTVTLYKEILP
ncbi:MAG: putative quinol monooxygenase [Terriglobia bacterium]